MIPCRTEVSFRPHDSVSGPSKAMHNITRATFCQEAKDLRGKKMFKTAAVKVIHTEEHGKRDKYCNFRVKIFQKAFFQKHN